MFTKKLIFLENDVRLATALVEGMTPDTEPSLIVRLRKHDDAEAWEHFSSLYADLLRNFFKKNGLSQEDAEDLTQDVLMRVARAAPGFHYDPAKGKFRSWLFTIARNAKSRFFSDKKRKPVSSNLSEVINNAETEKNELERRWDREYRRHIFEWACTQVKPEISQKAWSIFWQSVVEQKQMAEIAKEIGITKGAAHVAKSRVAAKVRECIQGIAGEEGDPLE